MRRTLLIGLFAAVACTGTASAQLPTAVQAVVTAGHKSAWMTRGDDPWAVFVCHVPADTQSVVYAGLPLRMSLTPAAIATILNTKVTAYFDALSHGDYRPRFRAGGEVAIAATDEPQACVDKALAAADDQAHGVIVVADAEHNAAQPGGFGNPGAGCTTPCPATTSRRSVYVGAADFSAEWGDQPPMDLIEHELGHALGWPHSGYEPSSNQPDRSALDVMSNSAAPRDVHPTRRDAPDTLAINRLAAGWLPTSAVVVVPPRGSAVTFAPSNTLADRSANESAGTRLAVIALDDHRFITVELLSAERFDDHLPASGLAVHLIEGSDSTRTQTPLIGLPPYDHLLVSGEALSTHGWNIAVGPGWKTTMHPIPDAPTVSS